MDTISIVTKNRFLVSLIIIGLLCLCFSCIVNAEFPVHFFGRRDYSDLNDVSYDGKGKVVYSKFLFNASPQADPDNITAHITQATRDSSCAIWNTAGTLIARTEIITSTQAGVWCHYTVNWTLNDTVLIYNNYYWIGIWFGNDVTGSSILDYDDDLGEGLYYKTYTTGQFKFVDWTSITGIDLTARGCIYCNYTVVANPNPPSSFNVVTDYGSDSSLSMSWSKGTYALTTRIMMKTGGYPTTVTDGTLIYNDTGTSYQKTGLTTNTIYYFSAWSWSTTYHSYSLTYAYDNERVFVRPVKPDAFIGNNVSWKANLFHWNKGINATATRIQYAVNTTYPSTVSSGTNTINSSEHHDYDTGLSSNSSYYYSAWSFNSTNGLWSSDYATLKINTNDTASAVCGSTDLTVYNNTAHTTGKYQSVYSSVTGWKIWLNYTGAVPTFTVYNNTAHTTGKYETAWDNTNWIRKIWLNYTGVLPTFNHYENIVDASGTHQHNTEDSGYTINVWANYTGNSCPSVRTVTLHSNILNATGTHEYNLVGSVYNVWANYSGNLTPLHHYENIMDAFGSHIHIQNSTGYWIWANYTGTGSGCSGIVWVNYSDSNLTFNVSVDKSDDSNTSMYSINDDTWLFLSGFSLDESMVGLFFVFALFSLAFIIDKGDGVWKPVLLFLDVPISLATGLYYLMLGSMFSINWWIGVSLFLFAILLSFGGLYYGLSFGRNKER